MHQLVQLAAGLGKLGTQRLVALGIIGLTIFSAIGLVGFQLSRPSQELLYAGLDRQDIARASTALGEAGLAFDIGSDGTSIFVRYGQAGRARMLLAEKGLPHGASAGYELFDKVGSLGLTSFMQEITRVRAVEGELAKTIELLRGVKAARVHIVMSDEGSFRRSRQSASASVVIKTDAPNDSSAAAAIRHLVAAAVPGMTVDFVTVIDSDGTLLASGEDSMEAAPGRLHSLEKTVSSEIQDNIRKTLIPYLSAKNFQISVAARLNTDKRQTSETIFNPESRVERSVRVIKETQQSQNSFGQQATSVQANLPVPGQKSADGKQTNEDNQKREELTNYEVSSKTVATTSGGYTIDKLSVALVINKTSLAATLGDKATPDDINKQIGEIEQLVTSVVGLKKDRGDTLKVTAVDFIPLEKEQELIAANPVVEFIARQAGSLISAFGLIGAILLILLLGVRPATRALLSLAAPDPQEAAEAGVLMVNSAARMHEIAPPVEAVPIASEAALQLANPKNATREKLEQLVAKDEVQSAAILKQWLEQGVAA